MKKVSKKSMKMSTSKKEVAKDPKAMSPQDKFKAMIAAKKSKAKDVKKMSNGAAKKFKGGIKMSMTKKSGKK